MKKHTRMIALVFAVLFIVFTAISLTVVLMEATHDCTGEDCPICAQIAALRSVVRSFAALLVILLSYALASAVKGKLYASFKDSFASLTPIELKVRLLN